MPNWIRTQILTLAIATPALGVAAIFVEQVGPRLGDWLETHPSMSGWAQALGGFLTILATAIIAGVQSRHSRHQLDSQISLQSTAIAKNEELQKMVLSHQSQMQQKEASRQRQVAIASLQSVYAMIEKPLSSMKSGSRINQTFVEVFSAEERTSGAWASQIQYHHLRTGFEVEVVGMVVTHVADFWRSIRDAADRYGTEDCHFYTGIAKRRAQRMYDLIKLLVDEEWTRDLSVLDLTPAEEASLAD